MARFTGGWIKIWRKAVDSDLIGNAHLWALWHALLCMATYKSSKILSGGKQVELPPGSVVFSPKELAERWECSRSVIQKWLHYLHDTQRIVLTTSPRGTIVTICNWDLYQSKDDEEDFERVNSASAATSLRVHREALNEEVKKERKEEEREKPRALSPEDLNLCFEEWKSTLRYFRAGRSLLADEQTLIGRHIQKYGAKAVCLALRGAKYEPKDDRYDPAKFLRLSRILDLPASEGFHRFLNLGVQNTSEAS